MVYKRRNRESEASTTDQPETITIIHSNGRDGQYVSAAKYRLHLRIAIAYGVLVSIALGIVSTYLIFGEYTR